MNSTAPGHGGLAVFDESDSLEGSPRCQHPRPEPSSTNTTSNPPGTQRQAGCRKTRRGKTVTALVDLSQDIDRLRSVLIALRRELRRNPELALEELWTAATLAGRMRVLGLAVQEGIGGTVICSRRHRLNDRASRLDSLADLRELAVSELTGP
jgi:hypothetical protein